MTLIFFINIVDILEKKKNNNIAILNQILYHEINGFGLDEQNGGIQ